MQWNFSYVSLIDVLENAMLRVLLSFNIFIKVLESLIFLLLSLEPICKAYSDIGFRLKVSFLCRLSLLNWCTAATTEEQQFSHWFHYFQKNFKGKEHFQHHVFASQVHKEFHCIILGSVKRKTSKTILAVKKKVLSVIYLGRKSSMSKQSHKNRKSNHNSKFFWKILVKLFKSK